MEYQEDTVKRLIDEFRQLRERTMDAAYSPAECCRKILLAEAINLLLIETLRYESEVDISRLCLSVAEMLTDSAYGFLGKVNGQGGFETIAISDAGWKHCCIPNEQAIRLLPRMEIRGNWSKPILQGKSVIVNHIPPGSDPPGVRDGHPAIRCLLGVALKRIDRVIGVIGLANRENGYNSSHQEDIETLSAAIVEAMCHRQSDEAMLMARDGGASRRLEPVVELAEANRQLRTEVAAHRRAEEALRDSERSYRRLLSAVTSDVYTVRVENGVPVATEYGLGGPSATGASPTEYAADPNLWINMVHPDDRARVQQYLTRVLADEDVPPLEHRIIHRDGTVRWVRNTIVPHHDRSGRLVCYNGLIDDITMIKWQEERGKRHMELLAARKIQQQLLPDGPPILPGFDIAGITYPAEVAAGDFFDYLPMRDGRIGFVVADVTGHGIGPAIVTASTHAYMRSLAEVHTEVNDILACANTILCREMKDGLFVTLLLARLDPRNRSFVYCSAGHPSGYIIDSSGKLKFVMASTGMPLGVAPGASFPAGDSVRLERGDLVMLLTDGLLEARSPEGILFGSERTIDILKENRNRTAGEIAESVCRAVQDFSERKIPLDDVTTVVIKVEPDR